MKKMAIIVGSLLLIAIALIIFVTRVPEKVILNRDIPSALKATYKGLIKNNNLNKWSAGQFVIARPLLNSAEIQTKDGGKGLILLAFKNVSTTTVHFEIPATGSNVFEFGKLEESMGAAIDSLARFASDSKNIYGMPLKEGSTTDTNLLAIKFIDSSYPSTEKIYSYIAKLQKIAASNQAKEVSYPMINVTAEYKAGYKCMVALPINKKITMPENNPVFFTRMVPAKFLIGEIRGGIASVQEAHKMIEEYLRDYQRTAMAIPFDYLVTDRLKETDTTKWVTRIYTPVF